MTAGSSQRTATRRSARPPGQATPGSRTANGTRDSPGEGFLKRWKFEVGVFFGGVGPDSSDEELRRIAPDHPVFRISSRRG
jgi:hypothetical protein